MIGKWDLTPQQYLKMPYAKVPLAGYGGRVCVLQRPSGHYDIVIVLPFSPVMPNEAYKELTGGGLI